MDTQERVINVSDLVNPNLPIGDINTLLSQGSEASIFNSVQPMLATLVDRPFYNSDWIYEVKWDGYRAIAIIENGKVKLLSRNAKSFNDKYYPITQILEKLKINAVIDGEILVINDAGVSNFGALQNWRSEADGELVMYVFDILWYEGKSLMQMPLFNRREILKSLLHGKDERIKLSADFVGGDEFFNAARKLNLEGVMAKKADSIYVPGSRSKHWLKIKFKQRQEVVIGGFTKNDGSGKLFSSLLLGFYENGLLKYAGKVGTGFSEKQQTEMLSQFNPLLQLKSSFFEEPDFNHPSRFRPNPAHAIAYWLKPELVCEVSYAEITSDGVFRHPSFEGMRLDKKAIDVKKEKIIPTTTLLDKSTDSLSENTTNLKNVSKTEAKMRALNF